MPPINVDVMFRDFQRYTGDGLPNAPAGHPLPVGDPASGVYNPTKRDFRELGHASLDAAVQAQEAAEAATAAMLDVQGATLFAADLAALQANTESHAAGTVFATRRERFSYRVLPAGTTQGGENGWHIATAGGDLLQAIPGPEGHDIRAFGAACDGVADDTAPLRMMMQTTETRLNIKGRVRITQNLTRAISTDWRGEGLQSSIILCDNNSRITLQGGAGGDHYAMRFFRLDGLSFRSVGMQTSHLVRIEYIGGTGGTSKSVAIRDCEFIGADNTGGFEVGIDLHNCRNVWMDNVRVHGARNGPVSGTGVRITGDNPAGAPVEFFLEGVQCYYLNKGFDVNGWVEGIYMSKCTAIACHYGFAAIATPAGRPLLYIRDCHFNTDLFGVISVGFVQFQISGNSFYGTHADGTSTASYVGIQIDASGASLSSKIESNDFQCNSPFTQRLGIVVQNDPSEETLVIGANSFSTLDVGVFLGDATNGIIVRDDNTFSGVAEPVRDLGIANRIEIGAYDVGGSRKDFGDGLQTRFGSSVVTLNSNGDGTIDIVPQFRATPLMAVVCNGDAGSHGEKGFAVTSLVTTGLTFRVRPNPGAVTVRVNWIAMGR